MSILDEVTRRIFGSQISRQVRAALAVVENENNFLLGVRAASEGERDRYSYDRQEVFEQALDAWRVNPLARRIVELTTQYVVGSGISVVCRDEYTASFLERFWSHPLNRMEVRVSEWCDELTRTGNLFILLSTDQSGMSYVRALPATGIEKIESRENDLEQVKLVFPRASAENLTPSPYPAYDPGEDAVDTGGNFVSVVLHYAINRPVGAQWGESDLAPLLKWLARYANWLEDRARLNRFRTAFMYVVKARFTSEADRLNRQRTLNANPPKPGSILVTDESEEWSVLNPGLDSVDAMNDGLALKKMIASGSGVPMHFLAEPESATRTTAEAAGGPTYRRFEQRQKYFLWLLDDLLRAVLRRGARANRRVKAAAHLEVSGYDISARDNISLALAVSNIVAAFGRLRSRGLIDKREYLRLVYRFAGEKADLDDILRRGEQAGPPGDPALWQDENLPALRQDVHPETGELYPAASGASEEV